MLIDLLGKILLPKQPDWQRRKHIITFFYVLAASLCFASIMAGFMLYAANKR
jgi:hypothetical protein